MKPVCRVSPVFPALWGSKVPRVKTVATVLRMGRKETLEIPVTLEAPASQDPQDSWAQMAPKASKANLALKDFPEDKAVQEVMVSMD